MATEKPRYNITVDEELLDEIERFRYENKISTRAGATVRLIKLGMEVLLSKKNIEKEKINKAPTAEEAERAMHTILQYRFDRKPTENEMELFSRVLPIIADGVKDKTQ